MNREDIICMAREAGFEIDCCSLEWHDRIERFVALVAEEVRGRTIESEKAGWLYAINKAVEVEREACAKVCELVAINACDKTAQELSFSIRARGEK